MMIQIDLDDTKTHFLELIKRTLAGDEVVIVKSGEPLVKLVPFCGASKKRLPGSAKGQFVMHPNFDDKLEII